ncbi:OprO/OprP family phosphate-selective porin [Gluconacetobacter azotocaptans]|nr:polyphosphate-selective porin O [Gluconacetobacter azotocaptans DSM 13594]
MDEMQLRSTLSVLFCTTALLGSTFTIHHASAAGARDPQLEELRREMQEMRGQIKILKARLGEPETHAGEARRARVAEAARRAQISPGMARDIHIGDAVTPGSGLGKGLSGVGTPPPDRGIVSSWLEFQAANTKEESVHVGGVRIGFPGGRPTFSTDDGAYAFSVGLAFHEDFGGFFGQGAPRGNETGRPPGFTENTRRMRLFFSWRYKDWVANVTPDFGGSNEMAAGGSATAQYLYEANLNYAGFKNTVLTVGYFQPRVTEEDSESSNDFMMMERPGITDVVRKIAAGDARFSIGGMHYDKRWWIGAYFTGQSYGARAANSATINSQTGGTFRFAGRPIVTKNIDVHMGVSAISAFHPTLVGTAGTNSGAYNYGTLSETPELNFGANGVAATLNNVSDIWAAGPELGVRYKDFLIKSEYYHIGVDRSHSTPGTYLPSYNFQGYYVAANYTLFGQGRRYNIKEGAFSAPGVLNEFNPAAGYWGALELSGRWSVTDLNDKGAGTTGMGGRETIWSGGLNWYLNRHFRVMVDYNRILLSHSPTSWATHGRDLNSFAARIQAAF